jgi:citrate lyase beta subunit
MPESRSDADLAAARRRLERVHAAARTPPPPERRQAVHTVYGGAHLARFDTARRLGARALAALEEYAPDPPRLAAALELPPALASAVHGRVREKLTREPVEDFRIDFEDGYGLRPDAEEDGHAVAAARAWARGLEESTLPPFSGIRVKPFSPELAERSLRTLDLFLTALVEATRGRLPPGFVVTLPKISHPEEVGALADALEALEGRLGLSSGAVPIELMIETPRSVLDAAGAAAAPALVAAGRGRVRSAHFGTYDYTASLEITAAHQHMAHPSCDFAKHVLQVSLAGSGVALSDGATNVLPVPVHRPGEGRPLSAAQREDNQRAVHAAWRLHHARVRHSLEGAYYQGWDLHPAQLPVRYAAVYGFFLEHVDAAAERLSHFVGQAARATLVGEIFDDAATGQGLLNYFLRAVGCGALTEAEAVAKTGLTLEELAGRSFLAILRRRAEGGQLPR